MQIQTLKQLLVFFCALAAKRPEIPLLIGLLGGIIFYVINLLILAAMLYIAGLMVVGGRKATFGDAFLISLLGTTLGTALAVVVSYFIPLLGIIVYILTWLALIKHFYETGWLSALAIAILAVIVAIAIAILVAVLLAIPIVIIEFLRKPFTL